jgi:hypothetical protein
VNFKRIFVPLQRSVKLCFRCHKPHLHFRFGQARRVAEDAVVALPADGDDILEIAGDVVHYRGRSRNLVQLVQDIQAQVVWTTGATIDQVTDPCLLRARETLRRPASELSLMIAHVLKTYEGKAGEQWRNDGQATSLDFCYHAVFVEGFVCPTLTFERADGALGFLNVSDLLCSAMDSTQRARAQLPVATDLLEAAPDEPTLSYKEMLELKDWQHANCQTMRPSRPWKHLILVSHKWSDTGRPKVSWTAIQERVRDYINNHLEKDPSQRDARIKAENAEDFGIWVDYMLVPNDPNCRVQPAHASGKDYCAACAKLKVDMIKRISALLTIATVIPMSQDEKDRGWILQEMSLDAHGATKFEHRDRVRLMAQDVMFSQHLDPAIDDGFMLRCNEFVRLGLTPRVWPDVGVALMEAYKQKGFLDEGRGEAWHILVDYARRFDLDCHRLKKMMAELVQKLAMADAGATAIPLDELGDAIAKQSAAMYEVAKMIEQADQPDVGTKLRDALESTNTLMAALPTDLARTLGPAWDSYRAKLRELGDGRSDPDFALKRIPIEERTRLTAALQWQQFVAVSMGLRAEWSRGAGLAAWVRAMAITEALGGTKFLGRLKNGQVRFSMAHSVTLAAKQRPMQERYELAKLVAGDGVPVKELEALYEHGAALKKHSDKP